MRMLDQYGNLRATLMLSGLGVTAAKLCPEYGII
jgi:hypothetical protein